MEQGSYNNKYEVNNRHGIEKVPGFPIVVKLESTDGLKVFYTVSNQYNNTAYC